MVKIIQALYDDNNKIIRDEELKRTKKSKKLFMIC